MNSWSESFVALAALDDMLPQAVPCLGGVTMTYTAVVVSCHVCSIYTEHGKGKNIILALFWSGHTKKCESALRRKVNAELLFENFSKHNTSTVMFNTILRIAPAS